MRLLAVQLKTRMTDRACEIILITEIKHCRRCSREIKQYFISVFFISVLFHVVRAALEQIDQYNCYQTTVAPLHPNFWLSSIACAF